jgi:hypothetical protein
MSLGSATETRGMAPAHANTSSISGELPWPSVAEKRILEEAL